MTPAPRSQPQWPSWYDHPLMNPMRGRVWSAGKLLLLVGTLLATFLLFAGVAMRVALRAREVQVPPLVGHPVDEATRVLAELGLTLRVDSNRRTDPAIPQGRILLQDPPAGAGARQQRSIRVWLSAGPRTTMVPELIGQTERTASIRLEQDGLDVGSLTEVQSPDYPVDAVVAQDPLPRAAAPRVSLLVNRGERATTYVMPDLVGLDGHRAAETLRNHGFRVTIAAVPPAAGVPAGSVMRQQPLPGSQVSQSDAISLEVSR